MFSDLVLDVQTKEFHWGALGLVVPEWMKNNLWRLWGEYQEALQKTTNAGKGLTTLEGKRRQAVGDGVPWAMAVDDAGTLTPPMPEFDPLELTTRNVTGLRKRPGAPKWVRELCKVLLSRLAEWEAHPKDECNPP